MVSPPLAGAWIEIGSATACCSPPRRSPPSRGRGLKFQGPHGRGRGALSPPSRGAWIEICPYAAGLFSPPRMVKCQEQRFCDPFQKCFVLSKKCLCPAVVPLQLHLYRRLAAGIPVVYVAMLAGCALMMIRKIQLRAVRGNVSVFVPVVRLPEKLLCGFCMVFFLRLRVSFQRNQQRLDILTDIGYTANETKLGSPERRRAP